MFSFIPASAFARVSLLTFARLNTFALLLVFPGYLSAQASEEGHSSEPVQIMAIATLHTGHSDNQRYSYDDLYGRIRDFDPHIVGIEIRQEDLGRDPAYLAQNYPLEMRAIAEEYESVVRGIDWLGADLEGRQIPPRYWQEQSQIKRLERELAAAPEIASQQLENIESRQLMILENATASSLNDGRYDAVSNEYYQAFARLMENTRYGELSMFYSERDRRIGDNAAHIVAEHFSRSDSPIRVVFVVGADHRGPLVERLTQQFGDRIELVPVP